jgi:DNA-binding SARP family transcriptional activator
MSSTLPRDAGDGRTTTLALTGGFHLVVDDEPVSVGQTGARLLAYLALAGRGVLRSRVAADLWQDSSPSRAARNLRTTLWRIPESSRRLVNRRGQDLSIDPSLRIDVAELLDTASRVAQEPVDVTAARRLVRLTELLPGWSDAWVIIERERLRLVCLEALEEASETCARRGRSRQSLELATAALNHEPLRETAWRLVVRAHRDQGNLAAAVTAYHTYCRLLDTELGIGPSLLMDQLIEECGVRPGATRR